MRDELVFKTYDEESKEGFSVELNQGKSWDLAIIHMSYEDSLGHKHKSMYKVKYFVRSKNDDELFNRNCTHAKKWFDRIMEERIK